MRSRRPARIAAVVAMGAGGMWVGHVLAYRWAIPSDPHRHVVLHETGHGYLPGASSGAALALVAAVLFAVAVGHGRVRSGDARPRVPSLFPALLTVQVGGFGVLEVVERLAAGAPLGDLVGPILWFGVLAQVLLAVLGALLLVGLQRVGELLGPSPLPEVPWVPGALGSARALRLGGDRFSPHAGRAPPALLGR